MSQRNIENVDNDIYVSVTKYAKDITTQSRLNELRNFFKKQYTKEPEFYVRVPGRVNIIGEHIDYCGYPVLPMAIEQSILLAVGLQYNDNLLKLSNIDSQFSSFKCDLASFSIDVPEFGGPTWYNYFLCGIKGVLEQIAGDFPKTGMTVAVSGNIPPSSGLSSSSALVSSATLTTAYIYNLKLNRKMLASISARCERYIGTQGGGMDQAIAYLAKQGCCQFIQFEPELKAISVQLPSKAYFVVANSLAEINKAATSDFNERVIECRTASRILAKRMHFSNWKDITKLATLQMAIGCSLEKFEQIINGSLTSDFYIRENIMNELDVSNEEFNEKFLTSNTKHLKIFKLRQRALHVVQESIRVSEFKRLCENDIKGSSIEALSELIRESHKSLKDNFECSHPSLDRLVEISEGLGVAARLTGAGWGGCIIALCESAEQCEKYISALKEKYYMELPLAKSFNMNNVIFATSPQNGAEILLLQ